MLNDASITIEKKTSPALGLGFRCGFLGLLHMDVFKQRLEQEYGLSVIATAPSVRYQLKMKHTGEIIHIESPSDFRKPTKLKLFMNRSSKQQLLHLTDTSETLWNCAKRSAAYKKA
jgi:GTP-binding protein LepA